MPPSSPQRAARRLLVSFGVTTTVVLAVVGFAMLTALGREAARHGEEDAVSQASTVASSVLGRQLRPDAARLRPEDLQRETSPQRYRAFDRLFQREILVNGIYKAKLYGPSGNLVYSTSPGSRDGHLPSSTIAAVLRDGERGRVIDAPDIKRGKAIEVFVPVGDDTKASSRGVLQVYLSYASIADARADQFRSVALVLALGALTILCLLMGVVALVSRRLRNVAVQSEHLAHHDSLTGLPNRRRFTDALDAVADDAEGDGFTLAIVDLDGFKAVNDTLGHQHGDEVLKAVALRLARAMRPDDIVARIGGDEFAVLVRGSLEPAAVESILHRIVEATRAPVDIGDVPVMLAASVGAVTGSGASLGSEVLMQQADLAMYVAKNSRSGVEFYSDDLGAAESYGHRVAADLRRALASDELVVHYQPQAGFGGELTGVEALVRWQHPDKGLVPPDEFIGVAERTGLIRPLTFFVLGAALRESARLRAQGTDVTMAVNLSALLLQDRTLPGQILELLGRERVPPNRLELEITESSLIENVRRAGDVLHELAGYGVRIAVDDWGTGYSSLQHLRQLPVTVLKIDRSLINGLGANEQDTMLVETTIALSRGLGLEVVAEGVETIAMWDRLADLGCDTAQGYYLAKPMASSDLDTWIAGRASGGPGLRLVS